MSVSQLRDGAVSSPSSPTKVSTVSLTTQASGAAPILSPIQAATAAAAAGSASALFDPSAVPKVAAPRGNRLLNAVHSIDPSGPLIVALQAVGASLNDMHRFFQQISLEARAISIARCEITLDDDALTSPRRSTAMTSNYDSDSDDNDEDANVADGAGARKKNSASAAPASSPGFGGGSAWQQQRQRSRINSSSGGGGADATQTTRRKTRVAFHNSVDGNTGTSSVDNNNNKRWSGGGVTSGGEVGGGDDENAPTGEQQARLTRVSSIASRRGFEALGRRKSHKRLASVVALTPEALLALDQTTTMRLHTTASSSNLLLKAGGGGGQQQTSNKGSNKKKAVPPLRRRWSSVGGATTTSEEENRLMMSGHPQHEAIEGGLSLPPDEDLTTLMTSLIHLHVAHFVTYVTAFFTEMCNAQCEVRDEQYALVCAMRHVYEEKKKFGHSSHGHKNTSRSAAHRRQLTAAAASAAMSLLEEAPTTPHFSARRETLPPPAQKTSAATTDAKGADPLHHPTRLSSATTTPASQLAHRRMSRKKIVLDPRVIGGLVDTSEERLLQLMMEAEDELERLDDDIEAVAYIRQPAVLIEMFRNIDCDHRGFISWDQFSSFCLDGAVLGVLHDERADALSEWLLEPNTVNAAAHRPTLVRPMEGMETMMILDRSDSIYLMDPVADTCTVGVHGPKWSDTSITSAEYIPTIDCFVFGTIAAELIVFDPRFGGTAERVSLPNGPVNTMRWCGRMHRLLCGDRTGRVVAYEVARSRWKRILPPVFDMVVTHHDHSLELLRQHREGVEEKRGGIGGSAAGAKKKKKKSAESGGGAGSSSVEDIQVHRINGTIVVGFDDGLVHVIRPPYGQVEVKAFIAIGSPLSCVAISETQGAILVGTSEPKPEVWSLAGCDGLVRPHLLDCRSNRHESPIAGITTFVDNDQCFTMDYTGLLKVWDLRTFSPMQHFNLELRDPRIGWTCVTTSGRGDAVYCCDRQVVLCFRRKDDPKASVNAFVAHNTASAKAGRNDPDKGKSYNSNASGAEGQSAALIAAQRQVDLEAADAGLNVIFGGFSAATHRIVATTAKHVRLLSPATGQNIAEVESGVNSAIIKAITENDEENRRLAAEGGGDERVNMSYEEKKRQEKLKAGFLGGTESFNRKRSAISEALKLSQHRKKIEVSAAMLDDLGERLFCGLTTGAVMVLNAFSGGVASCYPRAHACEVACLCFVKHLNCAVSCAIDGSGSYLNHLPGSVPVKGAPGGLVKGIANQMMLQAMPAFRCMIGCAIAYVGPPSFLILAADGEGRVHAFDCKRMGPHGASSVAPVFTMSIPIGMDLGAGIGGGSAFHGGTPPVSNSRGMTPASASSPFRSGAGGGSTGRRLSRSPAANNGLTPPPSAPSAMDSGDHLAEFFMSTFESYASPQQRRQSNARFTTALSATRSQLESAGSGGGGSSTAKPMGRKMSLLTMARTAAVSAGRKTVVGYGVFKNNLFVVVVDMCRMTLMELDRRKRCGIIHGQWSLDLQSIPQHIVSDGGGAASFGVFSHSSSSFFATAGGGGGVNNGDQNEVSTRSAGSNNNNNKKAPLDLASTLARRRSSVGGWGGGGAHNNNNKDTGSHQQQHQSHGVPEDINVSTVCLDPHTNILYVVYDLRTITAIDMNPVLPKRTEQHLQQSTLKPSAPQNATTHLRKSFTGFGLSSSTAPAKIGAGVTSVANDDDDDEDDDDDVLSKSPVWLYQLSTNAPVVCVDVFTPQPADMDLGEEKRNNEDPAHKDAPPPPLANLTSLQHLQRRLVVSYMDGFIDVLEAKPDALLQVWSSSPAWALPPVSEQPHPDEDAQLVSTLFSAEVIDFNRIAQNAENPLAGAYSGVFEPPMAASVNDAFSPQKSFSFLSSQGTASPGSPLLQTQKSAAAASQVDLMQKKMAAEADRFETFNRQQSSLSSVFFARRIASSMKNKAQRLKQQAEEGEEGGANALSLSTTATNHLHRKASTQDPSPLAFTFSVSHHHSPPDAATNTNKASHTAATTATGSGTGGAGGGGGGVSPGKAPPLTPASGRRSRLVNLVGEVADPPDIHGFAVLQPSTGDNAQTTQQHLLSSKQDHSGLGSSILTSSYGKGAAANPTIFNTAPFVEEFPLPPLSAASGGGGGGLDGTIGSRLSLDSGNSSIVMPAGGGGNVGSRMTSGVDLFRYDRGPAAAAAAATSSSSPNNTHLMSHHQQSQHAALVAGLFAAESLANIDHFDSSGSEDHNTMAGGGERSLRSSIFGASTTATRPTLDQQRSFLNSSQTAGGEDDVTVGSKQPVRRLFSSAGSIRKTTTASSNGLLQCGVPVELKPRASFNTRGISSLASNAAASPNATTDAAASNGATTATTTSPRRTPSASRLGHHSPSMPSGSPNTSKALQAEGGNATDSPAFAEELPASSPLLLLLSPATEVSPQGHLRASSPMLVNRISILPNTVLLSAHTRQSSGSGSGDPHRRSHEQHHPSNGRFGAGVVSSTTTRADSPISRVKSKIQQQQQGHHHQQTPNAARANSTLNPSTSTEAAAAALLQFSPSHHANDPHNSNNKVASKSRAGFSMEQGKLPMHHRSITEDGGTTAKSGAEPYDGTVSDVFFEHPDETAAKAKAVRSRDWIQQQLSALSQAKVHVGPKKKKKKKHSKHSSKMKKRGGSHHRSSSRSRRRDSDHEDGARGRSSRSPSSHPLRSSPSHSPLASPQMDSLRSHSQSPKTRSPAQAVLIPVTANTSAGAATRSGGGSSNHYRRHSDVSSSAYSGSDSSSDSDDGRRRVGGRNRSKRSAAAVRSTALDRTVQLLRDRESGKIPLFTTAACGIPVFLDEDKQAACVPAEPVLTNPPGGSGGVGLGRHQQQQQYPSGDDDDNHRMYVKLVDGRVQDPRATREEQTREGVQDRLRRHQEMLHDLQERMTMGVHYTKQERPAPAEVLIVSAQLGRRKLLCEASQFTSNEKNRNHDERAEDEALREGRLLKANPLLALEEQRGERWWLRGPQRAVPEARIEHRPYSGGGATRTGTEDEDVQAEERPLSPMSLTDPAVLEELSHFVPHEADDAALRSRATPLLCNQRRELERRAVRERERQNRCPLLQQQQNALEKKTQNDTNTSALHARANVEASHTHGKHVSGSGGDGDGVHDPDIEWEQHSGNSPHRQRSPTALTPSAAGKGGSTSTMHDILRNQQQKKPQPSPLLPADILAARRRGDGGPHLPPGTRCASSEVQHTTSATSSLTSSSAAVKKRSHPHPLTKRGMVSTAPLSADYPSTASSNSHPHRGVLAPGGIVLAPEVVGDELAAYLTYGVRVPSTTTTPLPHQGPHNSIVQAPATAVVASPFKLPDVRDITTAGGVPGVDVFNQTLGATSVRSADINGMLLSTQHQPHAYASTPLPLSMRQKTGKASSFGEQQRVAQTPQPRLRPSLHLQKVQQEVRRGMTPARGVPLATRALRATPLQDATLVVGGDSNKGGVNTGGLPQLPGAGTAAAASLVAKNDYRMKLDSAAGRCPGMLDVRGIPTDLFDVENRHRDLLIRGDVLQEGVGDAAGGAGNASLPPRSQRRQQVPVGASSQGMRAPKRN